MLLDWHQQPRSVWMRGDNAGRTRAENSMTYRTLAVAVLTIFCLSGADRAYSQEKQALIKKLVEVTDMTGQIKAGAQSATAPIMEQIKQANPTMPADTFTYIQGKVEGELSNIMTSFMEQWGFKTWEQ